MAAIDKELDDPPTDAPLADGTPAHDATLATIVEQMADDYRQQGGVDLAIWQARYPQLASELARLVPTIGLLADLSAAVDESSTALNQATIDQPAIAGGRSLGDYRIVREIGRGGMGIVYEAEQLSLQRRVALKTLPTAAVLDPRTLQRFKNEAQAAAALDHPHIVDVYGVGVERGVHFYAMRLIDGCTLADTITELRTIAGKEQAIASDSQPPVQRPGKSPSPSADTRPTAGLSTFSTLKSLKSQQFFQAVADLGRHVAEALDHAHSQGVIHRDIKPSNLMLESQGKVWVADFGLAHIETNAALTMTGDLLGTLRYMSPEQALANRVPIDHRTDIYSLGATLYELLTLEPLFAEHDRAQLLQRIATTDPIPPRQRNPQIPSDLETILLKAVEKSPTSRYSTAQELADDFARFASGAPIAAQRRTWLQQMARWSARNRRRLITVAVITLLFVASLGSLLGWQVRGIAARQAAAEQLATTAIAAAANDFRDHRWQQAAQTLEQVEALVSSQLPASNPVVTELLASKRQAQFAQRLEDIRLLGAATAQGFFDFAAIDRAYQAAFASYGIDLTANSANANSANVTVSTIRRTPLAGEIAAALTNWSVVRRRLSSAAAPPPHQLMALAKDIELDPWRNRFRDALLPSGIDNAELTRLLLTAPLASAPPATQFLAIQIAANQGLADSGVVEMARAAQRRHPSDFWINVALASYFQNVDPPRYHEAVRYYTVALGLRPPAAAIHSNLGTALHKSGRRHEAIAEYQRAIELDPAFAAAYCNLGYALFEERQLETAEQVLRRGLALRDDHVELHSNLGHVLCAQGKRHDAQACYRRALALRPDFTAAQRGLDSCLKSPPE